MRSVLIAVGIAFLVVLVLYNRPVPDAEELEFEKKFDRDATLVATCGSDPGLRCPLCRLRVYRYMNELWFKDDLTWRRVEGKTDNICDVFQFDTQSSRRQWRR
jgi:hypothetical protein